MLENRHDVFVAEALNQQRKIFENRTEFDRLQVEKQIQNRQLREIVRLNMSLIYSMSL